MSRPSIITDNAFREPRDGERGPRGPAGDSVKGDKGEPGMEWAGNFSRRVTYKPGQVVGFEGSSYVCILESVGREPTNTRYFEPLAVKGERGERGERGGAGQRGRSLPHFLAEQPSDGETVEAVFDSPASLGMAVYVSGDGHVDLARADAQATALPIVGLKSDDGEYKTAGALRLDDWTDVIGTPSLTPTAAYFLSPTDAGQLTTTEPENVGEYVIIVGIAASTKTLIIEIHRAYQVGE